MKKLLLFLVRALGISLLFIPILQYLHLAYKFALALITSGEMPTAQMVEALKPDSAGSVYTFLVLLLATPGMNIRKRIIGVVAGIALFLIADSFMAGFLWPYLNTHKPTLVYMATMYGWLVVAHYLLPFLLWIVLSFRQIEELGKPQMQARQGDATRS